MDPAAENLEQKIEDLIKEFDEIKEKLKQKIDILNAAATDANTAATDANTAKLAAETAATNANAAKLAAEAKLAALPTTTAPEYNDMKFGETPNAYEMSETERIIKFIENNDVTKFVSKKGKKIYLLNELLHTLRYGNLPPGTIYTTTKNKYVYELN
jgi:hypothetical protein